VASASGGQWSFAEGGITASGELLIEPRSNGINNSCRLTVRGSLITEPFSTTGPVSRVGTITALEVTGCTQARPRPLFERGAWSLTYESFIGTLPDSVTALTLTTEEVAFLVERFGELGTSSCLYTARFKFIFGLEYLRETSWEYRRATLAIGEQTYRVITSLSGVCPTPTLSATLRTERTVTLRGVFANPSPVEFGRVATESVTQRSVSFSASEVVTVGAISMERGNYFAITDPNRCIGNRLAAGATCTFRSIFSAPSEAAREVSDRIRIETTRENIEDTVRGTT